MSQKIIAPVNGLTDTFIRKLKPQDKPYEISDKGCKGLRIRITAVDGKTFLSTIYVNSIHHGHLP